MTSSPLNDLAERLERRAKAVRAVQQMLHDDPDLATQLCNALAVIASRGDAPAAINGSVVEKGSEKESGRLTNFDRIAAFFIKRENQWKSLEEIHKGTGLAKNSVAQVVYKTRPDDFEGRSHPSHGRRKQWRLKNLPADPH